MKILFMKVDNLFGNNLEIYLVTVKNFLGIFAADFVDDSFRGFSYLSRNVANAEAGLWDSNGVGVTIFGCCTSSKNSEECIFL
jgi:hypothetical protein